MSRSRVTRYRPEHPAPPVTIDPGHVPSTCRALSDQGAVCALRQHHRGWHLGACGWSWHPETGEALRFPTTNPNTESKDRT